MTALKTEFEQKVLFSNEKEWFVVPHIFCYTFAFVNNQKQNVEFMKLEALHTQVGKQVKALRDEKDNFDVSFRF